MKTLESIFKKNINIYKINNLLLDKIIKINDLDEKQEEYVKNELEKVANSFNCKICNFDFLIKDDKENININYNLRNNKYIINYKTTYSNLQKNSIINSLSLEYNNYSNIISENIIVNFRDKKISISHQEEDYNLIMIFYLEEKKIAIKALEIDSKDKLYSPSNNIKLYNKILSDNYEDFYNNIILGISSCLKI